MAASAWGASSASLLLQGPGSSSSSPARASFRCSRFGGAARLPRAALHNCSPLLNQNEECKDDVCDRLIEVFLVDMPDPEEWRKLLAFSREWKGIRSRFFKRCQQRAAGEADPGRMGGLYKLSRRLKEIDDEMSRHNELVHAIENDVSDLPAIVASRRKDFTGDFFKHIRLLCEASVENPSRANELFELASKCLAAVEEYDKLTDDGEAMAAAHAKFEGILNSPSLGAACKKIDELVRKKEFDPSLMLVISKAWAAAKESTMMKEEVKDIMYHLYNVARGNMQRLVPKEVRILKHLITLQDPNERSIALAQAFTPGEEVQGQDVDLLYITPTELYRQIEFILDAYQNNEIGGMIKEAQRLMDPAVIDRLTTLKQVIRDEYL